jgi:hypothetical protein
LIPIVLVVGRRRRQPRRRLKKLFVVQQPLKFFFFVEFLGNYILDYLSSQAHEITLFFHTSVSCRNFA